jgi:hypothetical protein
VAIAGETRLDVTPTSTSPEADHDPRPALVLVDEELVALVTAPLIGRTSKSEVADEVADEVVVVVVVAERSDVVVVVVAVVVLAILLVVLLDGSEPG